MIYALRYTEIELAEDMSIPRKISGRNPVCRLCGGSHESRYMLRIFSKAGLSKDLYSKVYKTCGIKFLTTIADTRSSVICGSGVTLFVDKMDQFIRRAQSVDNTPSDLNSEYSVKRLRSTVTAFASAVERGVYQRIGHPKASMWMSRNKRGRLRPTLLLLHAKMLLVPIRFFHCCANYALEGSTFSLSKCDFSRLFHTERSWHTLRFTVVFVSGRQDLPSDARAVSLTSFQA